MNFIQLKKEILHHLLAKKCEQQVIEIDERKI